MNLLIPFDREQDNCYPEKLSSYIVCRPGGKEEELYEAIKDTGGLLSSACEPVRGLDR